MNAHPTLHQVFWDINKWREIIKEQHKSKRRMQLWSASHFTMMKWNRIQYDTHASYLLMNRRRSTEPTKLHTCMAARASGVSLRNRRERGERLCRDTTDLSVEIKHYWQMLLSARARTYLFNEPVFLCKIRACFSVQPNCILGCISKNSSPHIMT